MQHKFEDGVYDIPNDLYHGSHGLSRSALIEFRKSPWHYWHKYLSDTKVREEPTPAMKMGELVHTLVLEPQFFHERFAVKPMPVEVPKVGLLKDLGREEFDRQKAAREQAQEDNELIMNKFILESAGKEYVSFDVYHEARTLADAVLKNDVAQSLFTGMRVEQSIYFTHKETGLQCKVRPDAWAGGIVTDLKTCKDASYRAFQSAAYSSGYFIQAAMIKAALESIGIQLQKFIFYCVEKSHPYPCVYYTLDDEALERGENDFNNLMYNIAHCMDNNTWQSYAPQTLTYPRWAQYED